MSLELKVTNSGHWESEGGGNIKRKTNHTSPEYIAMGAPEAYKNAAVFQPLSLLSSPQLSQAHSCRASLRWQRQLLGSLLISLVGFPASCQGHHRKQLQISHATNKRREELHELSERDPSHLIKAKRGGRRNEHLSTTHWQPGAARNSSCTWPH